MNYSLLTSSLLLAALTSQAQQSPLPATATTLFADYWLDLVPADQAAYRIQRLETPGQSRLDSVFYLTPKRLLRVSSTRWQSNGDTLVTTTAWRAGGQLQAVDNALGYRAHGEYRAYDAAGQLKLTAQYDRGRQLGAQCFAPDGTLRPCTSTEYSEKMPVFPGGTNDAAGSQQRLMRYVGQHLRYPAEALRRQQEGVVIVSFVVSETGEVRDLRVGGGTAQALNQEALRLVRSLPRWIPGEQDGEPVPVPYFLPITFSIR